MKIDFISAMDDKILENLKKCGFDAALYINEKNVINAFTSEQLDIKAYSGKEYDFVIRKGRANIVYGMESNGFLLNKGLCSKLKENNIFVVFSFSSLLKTDNIFKVYKNLLINGKLCNDYGVNCIYSSFAKNQSELLSTFQIEAFASEFGYNYKNMIKSYEALWRFMQ